MSRLSDAAYDWLKRHAPAGAISSDELWSGLARDHPELTAVSQVRKTPRTTLMRDLRVDKMRRFVVGGRRVSLAAVEPKNEMKDGQR